MQYNDAEALFAKARDKNAGKPIGNNTRLVQVGSDYAIRLHETNIVTLKPDGSIILNSGGYRTMTTKSRINEHAPGIHITQDMGLWYVHVRNQMVFFEDGMVIPATGPITGNDGYAMQKAKAQVDKMVSAFIKGYVNKMLKDGIEQPGDGDCWGCAMRDESHPENTEPMGYDHYLSHFEEKYYVPTIFFQALDEKGYPNPGLIMQMMSTDSRFMKREATVILQAYFRKRKLGIAEQLARRTV